MTRTTEDPFNRKALPAFGRAFLLSSTASVLDDAGGPHGTSGSAHDVYPGWQRGYIDQDPARCGLLAEQYTASKIQHTHIHPLVRVEEE